MSIEQYDYDYGQQSNEQHQMDINFHRVIFETNKYADRRQTVNRKKYFKILLEKFRNEFIKDENSKRNKLGL